MASSTRKRSGRGHGAQAGPAAAALIETILGLNTRRSQAELQQFLVDAAARHCSAERVLLLIEGQAQPHIAGARLPPGEGAPALLHAITPWLAEARRTRTARLRHGPRAPRRSINAPAWSPH